MKPIDLHLLNAEAKFKETINHAFDLGWEASEERIIKLLEEIAETDKYRAIWELIIAIKGEK